MSLDGTNSFSPTAEVSNEMDFLSERPAKKLQHSRILKYWERALSRFGGYSTASNGLDSSDFCGRSQWFPE